MESQLAEDGLLEFNVNIFREDFVSFPHHVFSTWSPEPRKKNLANFLQPQRELLDLELVEVVVVASDFRRIFFEGDQLFVEMFADK